jgi:glycosyltransferase involved in cell wall biosynthesis
MGIGTSFYHTAQVLKTNGFDVTILYCNLLSHLTKTELDSANFRITNSGFKIDYLFGYSLNIHDLNKYHPNDLETVSSYLAYRYLKNKNFDIIIFPDWRGLGFYTLQAKKLGLAFLNTPIWVQAHSTCIWHGLNNEQCDYDEHDIRVFYLERKSVELADLLVSPTGYLLNWMARHGFVFPDETFVQPCLLSEFFGKPPTTRKCKIINELVFFGRLEKRKGLKLFIQSLIIIHKEQLYKTTSPITVTFLGKITEIEGVSSYDYVLNELEQTNFTLQFLTSLNSVEAVSYLKGGGKLAVIPSIADNSPFTVLECIYNEIPFIASDAGGIPEIVNETDHENVLFQANPHDLARKITIMLGKGAETSFPAVNQECLNIPLWISAIRLSVNLHKTSTKDEIRTPEFPISVCITEFDHPQHLSITLDCLSKQTFKNFEVILADDGSKSSEVTRYLDSLDSNSYPYPLRIIRKRNISAITARKMALSIAHGEFIVILSDACQPTSDQIETFYSCITHSDFNALSCIANLISFADDTRQTAFVPQQYIPLGSGLAPNLFGNYYGAVNCIARKDTLSAICGLSTEDESITWEGNELFSKIELSGGKTSVIPEPLLHLKSHNITASFRKENVSNYYTALGPALDAFPWATFGDALLLSVGQKLRQYTSKNANSRSVTSNNLVNSSEQSVLSLRWLTRRMSEVDDHNGVITTLLYHRRASSTFDFCLLEFISYFLHNIGPLHEAKKHCIGSSEIEFIHSYCSIISNNSICSLIDFVTSNLNDSIDSRILLAKLYIMNGKLLDGLQMCSSTFCDIDNKYKHRNSEYINFIPINAHEYLNNNHLRSGLCHWLLHGKNEGRILEYCAPAISPITSHNNETFLDYQLRLENVLNHSLAERGKLYSQLLYEALENNTPIFLSDLATVILRDANLSYLETYPEAQSYTSAEFSCRGIKHYTDIGMEEGKLSLLCHLDRNYRDIFDNYCSQLSSRINPND